MNVARTLVHLLGVALVAAAVWLLFTETGLSRWVPFGLLAFAVLLVVGLGLMGAADRADDERVVEERVVERRIE